jgi:hypothetical protein
MNGCLKTLDSKVQKLIGSGANGKLQDWFLTGDINFFTNTAENYIIDYLQVKNKVIRNTGRSGIDAYADIDNENIGIEVTTLNGFIEDTIFTERLQWKLEYSGYLADKSLTMICDAGIIDGNYNRIESYINDIYEMIIKNDFKGLQISGIQLEIDKTDVGTISRRWCNNAYPWFDEITVKIINKLTGSQKANQFKQYSKNLVFLGVNNCSTINAAIPTIFSEMTNSGQHYSHEIQMIETYWTNALKLQPQIKGICYYNYSLDQETPYYPLKMFWRDSKDIVNINL